MKQLLAIVYCAISLVLAVLLWSLFGAVAFFGITLVFGVVYLVLVVARCRNSKKATYSLRDVIVAVTVLSLLVGFGIAPYFQAVEIVSCRVHITVSRNSAPVSDAIIEFHNREYKSATTVMTDRNGVAEAELNCELLRSHSIARITESMQWDSWHITARKGEHVKKVPLRELIQSDSKECIGNGIIEHELRLHVDLAGS